MTTILSFIPFLTLLLLIQPAYSQIKNARFENWSGGKPADWFVADSDPYFPVTQTADAHSGSWAVRGMVVPTGFGVGVLPLIQNGSDGEGTPFQGRPKSIRGWYKCQPVGGDVMSISVALLNGDVAIAAGAFQGGATDAAYQEFSMNMLYVDSATYPTRILITCTISGPGGAYPSEGSVFYLDDLSTLAVSKPVSGDLVIAGEVDTIKWADGGINTVDLSYSLDSGMTFHEIENDYPADSGKYVWDVPDTLLSREAMVLVRSSQDPENNDTSDVFHVKAYELTRVNDDDEFERFLPESDGWNFCNCASNVWPEAWWQQFDYLAGTDPNTGNAYPNIPVFNNATPSDHPDWPLFVTTFGVAQCYNGSSSPPASYNRAAVTLWAASKGAWGGSCEGYAVSSLLYFYSKSGLLGRYPGIGSYTRLNSAPVTQDAQDAINTYYLHQFGKPYDPYEQGRVNTITAQQTLQELKDMFRLENGDAKPLGFYNNTGSGGHAVTPYKIERIGTSSRFTMRVYDSNVPGSRNQTITLDSAANTWTDNTGLGWGTGTTGCLLGLVSATHFATPGVSIQPGIPPRNPVSLSVDSSLLQVYNSINAGIRISATSGDSIGYRDSVAYNFMPGGVPVIPRTGAFHPPIGYSLQSGDYSVQMDAFTDSSVYAFFMTDSTIYNYRRSDAVSTQTDMIGIGDGIGLHNPDATMKTVELETIIIGDSSQRVFNVSAVEMSAGDSVSVRELNRGELSVRSIGTGKTYDIHVTSAVGAGDIVFAHTGIQLDPNSTHQIMPDWNNLETGELKILIDTGNDDTVDDSLLLSNQLTEVGERYLSAAPHEFHLSRNYPNPFNPTTQIEFSLSERSDISLKVFSVLGEEVRVLAEGTRQAGTYRVVFDAADLPAGVYFYKLTAGNFVETRKMVLVK